MQSIHNRFSDELVQCQGSSHAMIEHINSNHYVTCRSVVHVMSAVSARSLPTSKSTSHGIGQFDVNTHEQPMQTPKRGI